MKLTIFGATGGTGQVLVRQALAEGHDVRAVVRTPGKLAIEHPSLEIVVADVVGASPLTSTVAGSDAVLSALGPVGRHDTTSVCTVAIRRILDAMDSAGVRRVVALSAQPVLRSGLGEPLWFRSTIRPIIRAVFRNVYADLERMEGVLRASAADWTVLRPPYLTDEPASGHYRSALEASVPTTRISRADLAQAMLDVLRDDTTIRHALGVGSAKRGKDTSPAR
ncbi:NAD(P)-dependent oxidoreductase [Streptoalloteichus hindustanus]|uniref:Putative NADH-flavin reductase n=1 Tax=Streptoalloteichus hindustanus TaxID=2017 RepID=A0A1M4Z6U6_STRHI|nr:SDR family oxidoreductase [Streptoalloteichus hindustanus]SHF13326.1 Putative NADH-flavin reductase [Streptoalloteichus hindustanus]